LTEDADVDPVKAEDWRRDEGPAWERSGAVDASPFPAILDDVRVLLLRLGRRVVVMLPQSWCMGHTLRCRLLFLTGQGDVASGSKTAQKKGIPLLTTFWKSETQCQSGSEADISPRK